LTERSPLWRAARELAAKTGESLAIVLERMEREVRGLHWKAWGATLRGVLSRDRLAKGSRINELGENESNEP
jgi:hypothetical protein